MSAGELRSGSGNSAGVCRRGSTFEFFLDDDRYAVPTLKLIEAASLAEAAALAKRLLRESPHHKGVEVCLCGTRVAGVGTLAERVVQRERRGG